jgi:hypothetical protein
MLNRRIHSDIKFGETKESKTLKLNVPFKIALFFELSLLTNHEFFQECSQTVNRATNPQHDLISLLQVLDGAENLFNCQLCYFVVDLMIENDSKS